MASIASSIVTARPIEAPPPAVAAVMVHVSDTRAALDWYARAFPAATRHRFAPADFEYLRIGSVQLECVPADAKVGAGPAGSVVYWRVPDLAAALAHFQSLGATLYRGPMRIEDGERMCQVRDPWGNCIGLRGPDRD
jgi:predicted enzyme related to lactoylglutathione lyase